MTVLYFKKTGVLCVVNGGLVLLWGNSLLEKKSIYEILQKEEEKNSWHKILFALFTPLPLT